MMSIYTFVKYDLLAHTKQSPEKKSLIMLLSFAHRCHGGVAVAASNPPLTSKVVSRGGAAAMMAAHVAAAAAASPAAHIWHPAVVVLAQSSFSL